MNDSVAKTPARLGPRMVPLDDLLPHPLNSNVMSPDLQAKLRAHIKRTGRYPFLVVRPHPDDTGKYQVLEKYGRDLTDLARKGKIDPVIGRDEEIRRVIQVLSRRTKNNPVLIGEPGVGKTAIVEGLATRIVEGAVPIFLSQKKILALDLSLIVAGTKYRGQFEERLKGIIRELRENPDLIIFIDEIHSLIGAGSAEGSLDAANILKPALSRGEVSCIGATTLKEYRKYIEKDRSLLRRFQAIQVTAPSERETFEILEGVKDRYEQFHKVRYSPEAIKTAVYQSNRYITDRFFPDSTRRNDRVTALPLASFRSRRFLPSSSGWKG